jgi:hypothetical protein
MVIAADGRKREHRFHRVLIRSFAKLHYAQAQAAIDGNPDDTTSPLLALVKRDAPGRCQQGQPPGAAPQPKDETGPI